VAPCKQSVPIRWVTLPVTFRDTSNYYTETLTFEVVDFSGPYHVMLGPLCYVKSMAIPSSVYLKLKIPRPAKVITVEAKMQWALDYEQDGIELAAVVVVMADLRELSPRVPTTWLSPTWLSLAIPPDVRCF
jgi:hypothetical protein